MLLKDLLSDVPGVLETRGDAEIQALVTDSCGARMRGPGGGALCG